MKVTVKGISGADAALSGLGENLSGAVLKAAEHVAKEARELCPVDTGALRASISVSAEGSSAAVSAEKDYAAFVEFGTCKTPAQPFLVPALINSAAETAKIVLRELLG